MATHKCIKSTDGENKQIRKRNNSNVPTTGNHQTTITNNKREKKTKAIQNNLKSINKMTVISHYISTTTLNVNGIKFPLKSYRLAEWIFKK